MFLNKIDWNNPRFKKWHLSNLGPLNEAQKNAFFEDDASIPHINPFPIFDAKYNEFY